MDPSIAAMALSAGTGADFELFGQAALQIVLGVEFEPTGGMHDGGQDGFLRPISGRADRYVQISIQQDYKAKIRQTIKRLQDGGRTVASLTYLTPLRIPEKDIVEADIEKTTGVAIRIRDQAWLTVSLQTSPELQAAFTDRYASVLQSLKAATDHVQKRYATTERLSVLVYLDNHSKSEPTNSDLLTLAVDAAIFMALKDTDPDQSQFRSEEEIVQFVENFFPAVKTKAAALVPARLAHLRTKQSDPRIRFHRGTSYALPYEVRSEFSAQNALLRQLDADFWTSVRQRATALRPGVTAAELAMVEDAVAYGLTKTFEQQGINLMASSQGVEVFEEVRTYEFVRESLAAATQDASLRGALQELSTDILRRVFYSGTDAENQYLYRLFKLYSVDFIVRGDEKVWRYFRNVARNLHLIVGTDIIVRALSEVCVSANNQATQNVLRILRSLGVKLTLTEQVLHEVYTHVRSADREYDGFYRPWDQHVTMAEAKQCSRIMIRAYYYAKLEPERHARGVSTWDEFLSQFGSAAWFREDSGEQAFAAYLQNKFGMAFVAKRDVEQAVPYINAKRIAERLVAAKKDNFDLAINDAYMMLYAQELRRSKNETHGADIHGFSTWWLTEESHAIEIAKKEGVTDRLKMHPQFLMNFVAALPGLRDVAEQNANSFPTVFGLRITHRVGDDVLKEFLKGAVEAVKSDEAAAKARIRELSNRLIARRN